jgi:magnesium transporter
LAGVLDLVEYSGEAIDFERHEAAQNLFQLVGIHVEQAGVGGLWDGFRRRFLWLPASIAGGVAAALLTGAFDLLLRQVVVLAFFIPVVLAVPESIAMQSVTIGLHRIQLSALRLPRDTRGLWTELKVGGLLGLASGLIAGHVAWLWLKAPVVGFIVAAAIWAGSAAGAVVGLAMPRFVHRAKLDPAVSSGPTVLALADVMTLAVYLALAATLLGE